MNHNIWTGILEWTNNNKKKTLIIARLNEIPAIDEFYLKNKTTYSFEGIHYNFKISHNFIWRFIVKNNVDFEWAKKIDDSGIVIGSIWQVGKQAVVKGKVPTVDQVALYVDYQFHFKDYVDSNSDKYETNIENSLKFKMLGILNDGEESPINIEANQREEKIIKKLLSFNKKS